jgi:hypothetical protein
MQRAPLVGQQARGYQRQGRVLVALDIHAPFDPPPALNHQYRHGFSIFNAALLISEVAQVDDLISKSHAELIFDGRPAALDQLADGGGRS